MPIEGAANAAQAANAYSNTAKQADIGPGNKESDVNFADLVRQSAKEAINTMEAGEKASAAAITGDADITQVVQAVNSAEMTLQTVVSVRDRMVSAYQQIMRMPI